VLSRWTLWGEIGLMGKHVKIKQEYQKAQVEGVTIDLKKKLD
jgi:hypothetical protein